MIKMQNSGRIHHGFLVVIACCAMGLIPAITWNCAGIFFVPVIKDLGILRGTFALYLTIVSLSTTIFLPFAGNIIAKANARVVLSSFVLLNAAVIGAMSTFTSVYQFYAGGVLLGMAQAFFLYLASPTLINRWFKVKTGFFTGLCMAFTGIGAVVLNPVGGYIIAVYGWRTAYLVFGLIIALIVFPPVALFIRSNPGEKGLKPYGYTEDTSENTAPQEIGTGVSVSAAVKSAPFFILLIFIISLALYNALNPYLPSYAHAIGKGTAIVATIASASSFGNMFGKILLGYLNDKTVIGTMMLCGLCGFAGIGFITFLGPGNSVFLLIGASLYGICFSAATVQAPLLVKKIFGTGQFSQVYSIVMMVYSLASAIGQSLWGFITDAMNGSFFVSLLIIIGLALIIPVASSIAYVSRKRLRSQ